MTAKTKATKGNTTLFGEKREPTNGGIWFQDEALGNPLWLDDGWTLEEVKPTPRELPLKTVISAGTFEYIKVAVNTWVEFGASRYDDLFSAYRDEDFGTGMEIVE